MLVKIDNTDYNTQWVDPSISGASALDDLTDVTLTTPVTDDVLHYNGTQWINRNRVTRAASVSITRDDATNATRYMLFTSAAGAPGVDTYLSPRADAGLTYNPLTGTITALAFVGSGAGLTNITLPQLSDVTITSVQDGEVIIWNATTSRWENGTVGGGATVGALDDLSDVVITSPASGQVLSYNGTGWVNSQVDYSSLLNAPTNVSAFTNDAGYLTSFTETDPVFTASAASGISSTDISNWSTAYGWGDHATAGYALSSSVPTSVFDLGITDGTSGQVLTTDGAGNLTFTTVSGGGASTLDELTDVTLTAPTSGQVLSYNGTGWVNAEPTGGSGTGETFNPFLLAGM